VNAEARIAAGDPLAAQYPEEPRRIDDTTLFNVPAFMVAGIVSSLNSIMRE